MAADGAREQIGDALLKNSVGLETNGVHKALGFQVVVDGRRSECRVAAKVAPDVAFPVAFDHGFQDIAPAIGTMPLPGRGHTVQDHPCG